MVLVVAMTMLVGMVVPASAIAAPASVPLAAAAPAFSCAPNTVYSVTASGGIYQTNATTGASTANGAFTVPSGDWVNALALGQAGNYIWAVDTDAATILRYDASTGLTTTYPTNVSGSFSNMIAGAIDPTTGIFYYMWAPNPATGTWYLYGFNTNTNTPIGSIGSISGMGSSVNGDIAFDAAGNLYIVSNADNASGMLSRVNGPLPTTQGNASLSATTITTNLPVTATQYNAVAFGPNGELVIGTSDPNTGTAGNVTLVDPATGAVISQAPGQVAQIDMASCAMPNTMVLQKNLPSGRFASSDQFTLTMGNVSTSANTATTTGTATGIQSNKVGPLLGTSGKTYTISETAASGSLSNYSSTWSCVDQANNNTVVGSGTGASGSFTMPNNAAGGAKIVCTITNTPKSASLKLVKSAVLTKDVNNDGKAGVGDQITYSFLVTNTGNVTLHKVTIADQLVAPAGPAVTVTCPTTTVAPGASLTCTSSAYTVTQADVDAGSVANMATAHGTTPQGPVIASNKSRVRIATGETSELTWSSAASGFGGSVLAFTGSNVIPLTLAGLLAIIIGLFLSVASRRRREQTR